jgi:hypothetical protein
LKARIKIVIAARTRHIAGRAMVMLAIAIAASTAPAADTPRDEARRCDKDNGGLKLPPGFVHRSLLTISDARDTLPWHPTATST